MMSRREEIREGIAGEELQRGDLVVEREGRLYGARSRQEEIRYQVGLKLIALHENYRDECPDYDFLIDDILKYLHSKNVMIVLPNGDDITGCVLARLEPLIKDAQ